MFWGSLEFDEDLVRKNAALSFDRSFYPPGIVRQHAAIIANGNRKSQLATITAPTLVIHGSEDPLLSIEHGIDSARSLPDAKTLIVDKMGHCLPKAAHGTKLSRLLPSTPLLSRKAQEVLYYKLATARSAARRAPSR